MATDSQDSDSRGSQSSSYDREREMLEHFLLATLRAFEAEFEDIRFGAGELAASQERLRVALADLVPATRHGLAELVPPPGREEFHRRLLDAATRCEDAAQLWRQGRGATFINAFVQSRQLLVEALTALYALRAELPVLSACFWDDVDRARQQSLEQPATDAVAPVGLLQVAAGEDHERYALYVPENYSPAREWPLIVALHGASGTGDEYLWTWLRLAKTHGYLVLAPKSTDITWSILEPHLDIASVTGAIDRVCDEYKIARGRVYLTGLSDGATFSYLLAFLAPEYFAGVAPIAGELSQVAEPLLRRREGREVPLLVVHGAHDHIFPIETVRSTSGLLTHLEYDIRFDELPDWGHAYPYRINRERVLPWFEALAARPHPG